uniref:DNA-directed RNA polymerase III subunit RPC7-like n=1 Tax=Neogobius melanostomus TaxID=47308 RepID=A0A8C6UAH0_9GOBI
MAGRGRGRGFRSSFAFDPERRETTQQLPSNQQPTALYPVLEMKPLPLAGGEQVEYLLALKQELRGASRSLPSFLQPAAKRRDVQRYSDKYHQEPDQDWTPDWTRFPKELRVRPLKPRPSGAKVLSRRTQPPKKETSSKKDEKQDVLLKLDMFCFLSQTLEQKEKHSDEEEEEKKAEEEEAEEEQLDEEEFEEVR